jgi:hypothetical protein
LNWDNVECWFITRINVSKQINYNKVWTISEMSRVISRNQPLLFCDMVLMYTSTSLKTILFIYQMPRNKTIHFSRDAQKKKEIKIKCMYSLCKCTEESEWIRWKNCSRHDVNLILMYCNWLVHCVFNNEYFLSFLITFSFGWSIF